MVRYAINMDLSEGEIENLNKLREKITLPYTPCEQNFMREFDEYYLVKEYYRLTKKGYLVYKEEFNEYIKENWVELYQKTYCEF